MLIKYGFKAGATRANMAADIANGVVESFIITMR